MIKQDVVSSNLHVARKNYSHEFFSTVGWRASCLVRWSVRLLVKGEYVKV